jgi:tetratricopeptide (TPR) repeat protein
LIQFEMKRMADVSDLLEEALDRLPTDLQFSWLMGRFLLDRERYSEAIPFFERLVKAGETGTFSRRVSYDLRIFGVLAFENLATCHFRLRQWNDAAHYYDLALTKDPERMDLRAKRSLVRSKAGSVVGQ